jgi:hypothetical protein
MGSVGAVREAVSKSSTPFPPAGAGTTLWKPDKILIYITIYVLVGV